MPRRSSGDRGVPAARASRLERLLLVAVTDRRRCRGDPAAAAAAALRGGASAVALRDRDLPRRERRSLARSLRRAADLHDALLLVHGDAALARDAGADGVHLGRGDPSPEEVRRVLGGDRLVGLSVHSAEEAAAAGARGADYAFLGAIWPTRSHPGARPLGPEALRRAVARASVPVVAIGGATPARLARFPGGPIPLRAAAVEALVGARDPAAAAAAMLAALAGGAGRRARPSSKGRGEADERTLVASFLARAGRPPGVLLGPGDDAVVVDAGGARLAACTDLTVEGVHFLPGTPPREAGRKAAARALSDLAAVGARPRWLLVGLALPRGTSRRAAEALEAGTREAARAAGARVVGGDTKETPGAMTLSVTALGTVEGRPPLGRGGARPGDALFVTGPLGGAGSGRHLRPPPRGEAGRELRRRGLATAAIDISDGLSTDLHRLCRASGTGALLRGSLVPVHRDARRGAGDRTPLDRALHDGEDYELLFAVPPERAASLAARGLAGRPVHRVGRVLPAAAGVLLYDTVRHLTPLPDGGWVHLGVRPREGDRR